VDPVSVVASFLVWTCLPWLLLGKRIPRRRLIPGGVLTATCTSIYGVASTIYMPRLFETYSERYGLFGGTLALIGWLLCIALIIVGATSIASELDRAPDSWARRTRRAIRIEPAADDPLRTEPAAAEAVRLDDVLMARSAAVPPEPGRPIREHSP
jgi:uncharacterized BrkB/YihY/UPF0761 family membrane protein